MPTITGFPALARLVNACECPTVSGFYVIVLECALYGEEHRVPPKSTFGISQPTSNEMLMELLIVLICAKGQQTRRLVVRPVESRVHGGLYSGRNHAKLGVPLQQGET